MKRFHLASSALVAGLFFATPLQAALIGDWRLDDPAAPLTDSTGNQPGASLTTGTASYSNAGVGNGTFGALTVTNASGTSVGFTGSSSYFTAGTDNSTIVQNLDRTGAFTVMGWINVTAFNAGNSYRLLTTGTNNGGDGGWGLGLKINSGDGSGSAIQWTNFGVADNNSTAFAVTSGQWLHLAATYNNGAIAFFLNGNAMGTANSLFSNESTLGRLSIGNRYNGGAGDQTTGYLDGLRVYDTVLTSGEIQTAAVASVSAVPEPSAYGLAGAGVLAAVALTRRRRRA